MEQYEILRLSTDSGKIAASTDFVYSYRMHAHTYYEMTLYEPFDGCITINGRDFAINSHTCIMVAPSDLHRITVRSPQRARFIKLCIPPSALLDKPECSIVLQGIETDGFLTALLRELLCTSAEDAYARHLVNAAVCSLKHRGEPIHTIRHDARDRLLAGALRILHEEFLSPITQHGVAERLSVTPQYLSRVFRDAMQIGFSEYLSDLRLDYAHKRLTESDDSITAVCYAAGYGNLSHFLRSFKKKYGISPGCLRQARYKNAKSEKEKSKSP